MNERMSDLLDRASDDGGAPLGFSGDTVVRRAVVRRRRRQGGIAVGLAAAGVVGVVVVTQLVGSSRSDNTGPSDAPSTTLPTAPSSSTLPALSPQEQTIVDRCSHASTPPPPSPTLSEQNPETTTGRGTVVRSSSTGRPATFLQDWTLDAHVQDEQGVTATFVNPDHTRWASCQLADGGSRMDTEVAPMGPVPTGPIPQSWYGPEGFRHHSLAPAWAQVCAPSESKVCARELFAGAFPRYADVASARVDAPDGTVLTPVFGDYTYVFRHTEERVDPNRAANDEQSLPSMPVTLLDGQGNRIIRYDYYPSYIVPGGCPSSGGC
jgi:hypothetical protein